MTQNPPIIFIILDGTRKDRLSVYGHERETSPHLDSFAENAVVFENAYTPGPWSLPAHTSMLTGLYPSEHGMTNVFSNESIRIPERMATIADSLSDNGYRTGGFSNNPWLGQTSGLDERFDLFLEWNLQFSTMPDSWEPTKWERRHSKLHKIIGKISGQPLALLKDSFFVSRALTSAERWIREGSAESFTFVNLMGAHTPYYPSKSAFKQVDVDPPSLLELRKMDMRIMKDSLQGEGIATTHTKRIREIYDASIRSQDEVVGQFLNSLKRDSLYGKSLIIIAADHGKTLGEFDRSESPTHYVRDININIPLIIKPPHSTESLRISEPFEMVNLSDFLQQDDYSYRWLQENTTQYALIEDFVPHTGEKKQDITQWRAVTDGQRKYITDDIKNEFFMNGTGPSESLVEEFEAAGKMREAMIDRTDQLDDSLHPSDKEFEPIDEDVESQLKDLGYLN